MDRLLPRLLLRNYSRRTLAAYRLWVGQFQAFVRSRPTSKLGTDEVRGFLTQLAVRRGVAASTQNQAFNALLFFCRHVLGREFGKLDGVVRAKRHRYVPVVLSHSETEANPEWHRYYELLWHLGGSQSDIATLQTSAIDWETCTLQFARAKTGSIARIRFGDSVAAILATLPAAGPLFPMLSAWNESDRASAFSRRCKLVGVSGVSLHCCRYAWAERAKQYGYATPRSRAACAVRS